jgi:hypothetical protein
MKRDGFEVFFEAMMTGDVGGAIMNQEARGQSDLVNSSVLPKDCPQADLEALGFVFGEDVDDLFVQVNMPAGWKKRATSHSMWSDLLDDKDRVRGSIFYKAAFYDRSARMSLTRRFSCHADPICGLTDEYYNLPHEERLAIPIQAIVYDLGTAVWKSTEFPRETEDKKYWDMEREVRKLGEDWLDEHYPDWQSATAYWD